MTHADVARDFLSEAEVYRLLEQAGLQPPRHGMLDHSPPFAPDEAIVLKGQARGLLHKSELGAVRFLPYGRTGLKVAAREMQQRIEAAGFEWSGALVCERLTIARSEGLPTEALVSLTKGAGGWTLLFGFGGLQAEAMAELAAPLCLPVDFVTPEQAVEELRHHLLGRIWLGTLRGTHALTNEPRLMLLLECLWRLRELADAEGLDLVEMNPVALDPAGTPRPLDGVARRGNPVAARLPPPAEFLSALLAPRSVALAGVSAAEGGVGRTILDNLRRCRDLTGKFVLIKPGQETFLGLPCLPDVSALRADPVDLLILALPAAATVAVVSQLVEQRGGARVVALVAGGIGDGADQLGLGATLARQLEHARATDRWTPAVVGPNFVGHWVPSRDLDSSFIPLEKLAAPAAAGGPIALLSQSGAFLLSRRSHNPSLPLGLALALGNQLDVSFADVLRALESRPEFLVVGLYVEGFGPGELAATAEVGARLREQGRRLWIYRAGRTPAGQAAAASHTGALAGNQILERALLRRAGFALAPTQQAFDAGLAWLGAYPTLLPGPVAVVTNAGFESVCAGDLLVPPFAPATLDAATTERLGELLASEELGGLVTPQLPLDLTPMASESGYLKAVKLLLDTDAAIVLVGLVPFTRRLGTDAREARQFAEALAVLANQHQKALGVVVDAGSEYEHYRRVFAEAGLPLFTRMEDAIDGLRALDTTFRAAIPAVAS